ncbi:MAG: hypothetical protein MRZ79_00075 [Bacteroidia bacterium]|nr:hypothetical protein [Bacteroidia bacterium]
MYSLGHAENSTCRELQSFIEPSCNFGYIARINWKGMDSIKGLYIPMEKYTKGVSAASSNLIMHEAMTNIGLFALGTAMMALKGHEEKVLKRLSFHLSRSEVQFIAPEVKLTKIRIESRKSFFKYNSLKCNVTAFNDEGILVGKGILSGNIFRGKSL